MDLAYKNEGLKIRFLGNLYSERAAGGKGATEKEPQEMCKKRKSISFQVSRHFKGQEVKCSERYQGMKK